MESAGQAVLAQKLKWEALKMEGAASVLSGLTQSDFLDALTLKRSPTPGGGDFIGNLLRKRHDSCRGRLSAVRSQPLT